MLSDIAVSNVMLSVVKPPNMLSSFKLTTSVFHTYIKDMIGAIK